MRLSSGLLLLPFLLPLRAAADTSAAPYRTWLATDAKEFIAQAGEMSGPQDAASKRRLQRLSALAGELSRRESPESLQRWGGEFFALAQAILASNPNAELASLERRLQNDFDPLLWDARNSAQPDGVIARRSPPAKGSQAALQALAGRLTSQAAATDSTLNNFYSGQRGSDATAVYAGRPSRSRAALPVSFKTASARVSVPLPPGPDARPDTSGSMARALKRAVADPATPSSLSASIVTAYFKNRASGRHDAVYSMDGYGQIVGVRLADLDYSETRDFSGGLLRSKRVEQDGVQADYTYEYDAQGRQVRRTVTRTNAQGPLGGATVQLSAGTDRAIRGWSFDADGNRSRLSLSGAHPLAAAYLVPAADIAPAVAPLLDWQLDSDRRLNFVSDDRDRDYHDPFWYRNLPRVSRGWTDRNDPSTWTRHPILGVRRPHDGVDMPMPEGTKVYAARRGKVIAAGWEGGYGQRIVIQHYRDNRPDGAPQAQTIYGHLSQILVKRGQWVVPGDTAIGLVGSTGISTGPHLHFEIREGDHAVDPITKLSPSMPNPSGKALLDTRLAGKIADQP